MATCAAKAEHAHCNSATEEMMMNRRSFVVGAAVLLSAGFISPALADTTWIMASGHAESTFLTKNIRMFIEEVEEKSEGKLKIDLRSNNSLIKLEEIKRAVQSGQVPIGEIRFGVYG